MSGQWFPIANAAPVRLDGTAQTFGKVWQAGQDFIVETTIKGGLRYGYHLAPGDAVSDELPVDSLVRFMPDLNFEPYNGNAAPVINRLRAALARRSPSVPTRPGR